MNSLNRYLYLMVRWNCKKRHRKRNMNIYLLINVFVIYLNVINGFTNRIAQIDTYFFLTKTFSGLDVVFASSSSSSSFDAVTCDCSNSSVVASTTVPATFSLIFSIVSGSSSETVPSSSASLSLSFLRFLFFLSLE